MGGGQIAIMVLLGKAGIYFNTVRYLRPVQLYGRIWFKLYRPRPQLDPSPPLRNSSGGWVAPAVKSSGMVSPTGFCFLNESLLAMGMTGNHTPLRSVSTTGSSGLLLGTE